MADPNAKPDFYKAFFDDATLSDLTIRLSDRAIQVHRIVLCRRSKYFTKLLTGRFKETGSSEIELKEDDSDSMVALLRYIYDLPYDDDFELRLKPYAMVYVVADKYQVNGLKLAVSDEMKRIAVCLHPSQLSSLTLDEDVAISDFLDALRIVVTCTTTHDQLARRFMVEACIANLQAWHSEPALLSLLRESADLGAEIIGHPNIACAFPGDWVCGGGCKARCTPLCMGCEKVFEDDYARRNHETARWICEFCQYTGRPVCSECSQTVEWRRRGL